MSSRRNTLNSTKLDYQRHPNIGLWLDKFITDHGKESQAKSKLVFEVASFPEPPEGQPSLYRTYFNKSWLTALSAVGASTRFAVVKNRMVVNLGSESVLETGIALQRAFGLPFIPGSALKGLVSHFLHQYGGDGFEKDSENHTIIFGDTENAGFVTFYDALYVPNSGFNGRPLHADVMTTHHPRYYAGEKERGDVVPPADWDSPNPVPFISATGKYLIALSGPEDWVSLTFDILGYALEIDGVGAKTSSGYGRMWLQDEHAKFGEKYKIRTQIAADGDSDPGPAAPSEGERLARGLIERIAALPKLRVPGEIPQLAKECLALNIDDEAKKIVANTIVNKIAEAGRTQASEERPWYREIVSISEGTAWVVEQKVADSAGENEPPPSEGAN